MDNINKNTKILFYDIETSLMELRAFTLYPNFISHKAIVKDWHILCAAFKWLGQKKTFLTSKLDDMERYTRNPDDDYHVVKTLRDIIAEADIIVGHNSKKFDTKKLNARIMYHGLDPLPRVLEFDTLQAVKRVAKFTSHRLDHLGNHFGVGGKFETSPGLWEKCADHDKAALKEMGVYCKEDVRVLERIYHKILPYVTNHPVIASIHTTNCPKCDSDNIVIHKHRKTASGISYPQYQCGNCGGYFTGRHSEREKSLSKA